MTSLSEIKAGNEFPTPAAGDIFQVDPDGSPTTIASKLDLPIAMRFGPDEKLYVSDWGYGETAGMGKILQFDLTCAESHVFKKENTN
jgi:hypothetical protein